MISKPRESIRLVLDCPLLQSKGTTPALPVLMKPAFIKKPIKLRRAQPSSTVNITPQKSTQGLAQGGGGGHVKCSPILRVWRGPRLSAEGRLLFDRLVPLCLESLAGNVTRPLGWFESESWKPPDCRIAMSSQVSDLGFLLPKDKREKKKGAHGGSEGFLSGCCRSLCPDTLYHLSFTRANDLTFFHTHYMSVFWNNLPVAVLLAFCVWAKCW